MYLTGEGRADLKPTFEKLRAAADPQLLVELRAMPFGLYGRLTDQFGTEWFLPGAMSSSE